MSKDANTAKQGRCATCKFWERYTKTADVDCYGAHNGGCRSEKFIEQEDKDHDDALYYWDFEGYSAGFQTGQNFGCIHWEKSE